MLLPKLVAMASSHPDEYAFVIGDQALSWAVVLAKVESMLEQVKKFEGSRILVMIDDSAVDSLSLMLACSATKCESILLSSFHSVERARVLAAEFDADFLLQALNSKIVVELERKRDRGPSEFTQPMLGLLTSGTSGTPKCARYDWSRISAAVVKNEKFKGRKWMMGYHLTNFAGLQVFLQCFLNGGCLVFTGTWPPSESSQIEKIEKNEIDYLNCTATFMRKILSRLARGVTTNLRSVTLGGEVVDQILIDGIKNVFPMVRVVHIYASTELGSSIEVRDEKAGFPLKLIDDHNLKIVDGELFVRKSSKSMLGYLQSENPSSSQKQFGEKELVPTGDLVEAVGDRVLFVGRRDDLINVGGFKVSPVAVEDVVRTVRGVGEVAISAMKNPISGNLVRADVILAQGANEHEVRAELLAVCKAKLAYYAVPRIINFVPTLNYTTTFKLKR